MSRLSCLSLLIALLLCPTLFGQEGEKITVERIDADRNALLEQRLDNVALVGSYTIFGKEDQAPKPERYEIKNVRKLEEGDIWLINARIKYGDKDVQLPLPLPVKWAGMTPVITLEKTTIPGMGTFSARVIIDEGKYAGTWTHGDVSGALFGRIEKLDTKADAPKAPAQPSPE